MSTIRARLHRTRRTLETATRQSELLWTSTFNLPRRVLARVDDRSNRAGLDQLVERLHIDGLAVTDVNTLLGPDRGVFETVREEAVAWAATRRPQAPGEGVEHDGQRKGYVKRQAEQVARVPYVRPHTLPPDALAALAMHPNVVEIARRYLGLVPRLSYYDVWLNLPTETDRYSQRWHRDPEDRKVVKMFITLEDVGPAQGPFHYARGSHPAGRRPHRNGVAVPGPRRGREDRFSDAEMAELVAPEDWVALTGAPGTVALADTAGYHKGGNRTEPRLMYTCTFVSSVALV